MAKEVRERPLLERFSRFSRRAAQAAGAPGAFAVAVFVVLAWALSGPLFGFSDTWQLFINTGTTIATFLMVFLIQRTQNKDTVAMQLKLNEILAATPAASKHLIDLEDLTDADLERLRRAFQDLADRAHENEMHGALSVEPEAHEIEREHARRGERRWHARRT